MLDVPICLVYILVKNWNGVTTDIDHLLKISSNCYAIGMHGETDIIICKS